MVKTGVYSQTDKLKRRNLMTGFEEYGDLQGVGFQGQSEQVPPEEEFFKSVYIAGITRVNHINIEEVAGRLQIRGLEYNLDEVNMVITHTKPILVREPDQGSRDLYSCFSYKTGNGPWHGTTKLPDGNDRPCPPTAPERAINDFCGPCKAQIIVAGICCKTNGSPVIDAEGKPVFIFLRGKGVKYGNISGYLDEMFQLDLPPIFEPVSAKSQEFEKIAVNNKRHVTRITMGMTGTRYGDKNVFVLGKGPPLDKESVMNILKVSKQTLEKFHEKFDWSRKRQVAAPTAEGVLPMDVDPPPGQETVTEPQTQEQPAQTVEDPSKAFSFDKIAF
jgi:hypothetical protein